MSNELRNSIKNKQEYIENLNNQKFGMRIKFLYSMEQINNEWVEIPTRVEVLTNGHSFQCWVDNNDQIRVLHENQAQNKSNKIKMHEEKVRFNDWMLCLKWLKTSHAYNTKLKKDIFDLLK